MKLPDWLSGKRRNLIRGLLSDDLPVFLQALESSSASRNRSAARCMKNRPGMPRCWMLRAMTNSSPAMPCRRAQPLRASGGGIRAPARRPSSTGRA